MLAFVCVPLLVLQIVLLAVCIYLANYVAGLLWMQATLLMILLPTAALATVTATIVQLLLALLIVVLYLIGMSWLSSQFRNSFSFRDVTDQLSGVLFFGTCIAVVLLQYARRSTARSRLPIVALGVVILLIMGTSPYEYFLARAYPELRPGESLPFRLGLLTAEKPPESGLTATRRKFYFGCRSAFPECSRMRL